MHLKPLTVAVIALKDKAMIILEALIAYEVKRYIATSNDIYTMCKTTKKYNIDS